MKSNLLMIGLKTDRRNEMRIIIAGSREYENQNEFTNIVNYIMTFDIFKTDESKEIISGHAHGADQLGEQFAKKMNYPIKLFIPNWKMYGKKAGHIRNKKMALYAMEKPCGVLIAFWDGESKGTKSMIQYAKDCKLKCFVYNYKKRRLFIE